jgi:hypothetical protein
MVIANTDEALGQNLSSQPPAMNQAAHNAMLCEVLQMLTRLETHAAHQHSADVKFAIDEMIRFLRGTARYPNHHLMRLLLNAELLSRGRSPCRAAPARHSRS